MCLFPGTSRWNATRRDTRGAHGKEGVDGSSPSEGLHKSPANGHVVLPAVARFRFFAGTRRVHFGTGGHSRARTTSRGTAWNVLETLDCEHALEKFLQTGGRSCPHWREADSLLRLSGGHHIAVTLASSPVPRSLVRPTRWGELRAEPNECEPRLVSQPHTHPARTSRRASDAGQLSSTVCQSTRGSVSPSGRSGLRQITSA